MEGELYFVLGKGKHVHDLFHSFCRLYLLCIHKNQLGGKDVN